MEKIMINQSQSSPRNYEINRSMTDSSVNEEKIIQESNAQIKPARINSFYQNEMSDLTSEFLEISESSPLRLTFKESNSLPINNLQISTKTSSNSPKEPTQKANEVQNKPRKESIQKTSKFKQLEAFELNNLNEAIVLEMENERNRLKPIEDNPSPFLEKKPKNSLEKVDNLYPMLQRGSVSEQHIRQIIEQRPRSPSKFMNQEIQIIKSNKLEKQDSKENMFAINPQKIEKQGSIKTGKKESEKCQTEAAKKSEKGQTMVNLSSIPSFYSDLRM